jgi:hypothetical protein
MKKKIIHIKGAVPKADKQVFIRFNNEYYKKGNYKIGDILTYNNKDGSEVDMVVVKTYPLTYIKSLIMRLGFNVRYNQIRVKALNDN